MRPHVFATNIADFLACQFPVQRYLAYFREVRRELQAALVAKTVIHPERGTGQG